MRRKGGCCRGGGACLKNIFCQMYPEWYDNAPDTGVYLNPYLRNEQYAVWMRQEKSNGGIYGREI